MEILEVSVVDCSVLEVYVKAKDMGMSGLETPAEIDGNKDLLKRCEALRGAVAYRLGLISAPENSVVESANIPHFVIVGEAREYISYLDQSKIAKDDIDFTARMFFMQKAHKTYAGTGSICTAVAGAISGSIVNDYVDQKAVENQQIRIGHPGGVICVEVAVTKTENGFTVQRAEISRTARRIMDGFVYIK